MTLKEFIVKALREIDGTELKGGIVHMDIAVYPDSNNEGFKLRVVGPQFADPGMSRIKFDVKLKAKEEEKQ